MPDYSPPVGRLSGDTLNDFIRRSGDYSGGLSQPMRPDWLRSSMARLIGTCATFNGWSLPRPIMIADYVMRSVLLSSASSPGAPGPSTSSREIM